MKPNAETYNPAPQYLRSLTDKAGISQRAAAKIIGIEERVMRSYLADPDNCKSARQAPYSVQFCLECLAQKSPD